jgi:hypothetical protein
MPRSGLNTAADQLNLWLSGVYHHPLEIVAGRVTRLLPHNSDRRGECAIAGLRYQRCCVPRAELIAHVDPLQLQRVHLLKEHLSAVAQMAEETSSEFGAADWGRLAGRWHDLGKYNLDFQQYIRASSGYVCDGSS